MGSKGSQTTTTSGQQTYSPTPQVGQTGSAALTAAQTAANAPFQEPVAPVAGFTPQQYQAFGEVGNLQYAAQPYFNTGAAYLNQSAQPVSAAEVANYYNPMAQNVTAQMQNIFGQQQQQTTGQLTQAAGGVGADRIAVGQSELANQQALAAGQTYAGLYQSALQAAQQQQQMEAGAGYGLAQMGPSVEATEANAINQLLGTGGLQQQLSQAQLNALYQQQLAGIAYPFQTAQYLAGVTGSLAPALGGTTAGQQSTTAPSPSLLAQILGLGTAGAGLIGGSMGGGSNASSYLSGYNPFGSASYGGGSIYTGDAYGGSASNPLPGLDASDYGARGGGVPFAEGGDVTPAQWPKRPPPWKLPVAPDQPDSVQGRDDGGGVNGSSDSSYGKLMDRADIADLGNTLQGVQQGNPIASEIFNDVGASLPGYDDGGEVGPEMGLPMGSPLTSSQGFNAPGAGKVGPTGIVPQVQSQGQPGRSMGPSANFSVPGLFLHAPSPGGGGGGAPSGGASSGQSSTQQDIGYGMDAAKIAMDILPMLAAKRGGPVHMATGGSAKGSQAFGPGLMQPLVTPGATSMANLPGIPSSGMLTTPMASPAQVTPNFNALTGTVAPSIPGSPTTSSSQMPTSPSTTATPMNAAGAPVTGGTLTQGIPQQGMQWPFPHARGGPVHMASGGVNPMEMPPSMSTPNLVGRQRPGGMPMRRPMMHMQEGGGTADAISEDQGFNTSGLTGPPTFLGQGESPGLAAGLSNIGSPLPPLGNSSTAPAMTTPATAAPAITGNVPMPQPRPDITAPIKTGADVRTQPPQAPQYPAHPTDPTDPNYDPKLDPRSSQYNPNDPRLVFADNSQKVGWSGPGIPPQQVMGPGPSGAGAGPTAANPFHPGAQLPYPQAQSDQQNWGQQADRSPWMALVKAGAAMASTRGPVGTVLASGLAAGAGELDQQRKSLQTEEGVNEKALQLWEEAQRHLDSYNKLTANQKEEAQYHRDLLNQREEKSEDTEMQKVIAAHPEWPSLNEAQRRAILQSEMPSQRRAPVDPSTPTSQLPPGAVMGSKDGVRGYQGPDGVFHPLPTG